MGGWGCELERELGGLRYAHAREGFLIITSLLNF